MTADDELLARLDVWAAELATPFPQNEVIAEAASAIRSLQTQLEAEHGNKKISQDNADHWRAQYLDEHKAREEAEAENRLIDVWCAEHGGKISWAKAVQIAAIVTKQSDAERDRLLHMGDEDGSCEMCGRNAIQLQQRAEAAESRLAEMERDARLLDFLEQGAEWHISTDYETGEITLQSVDGNINDREYNNRGKGDTIRAAIESAQGRQG